MAKILSKLLLYNTDRPMICSNEYRLNFTSLYTCNSKLTIYLLILQYAYETKYVYRSYAFRKLTFSGPIYVIFLLSKQCCSGDFQKSYKKSIIVLLPLINFIDRENEQLNEN